MVTVDVVLFARGPELQVLLIERGHAPFAGRWALPGGFLDLDEELEQAARRELREETGLEVGELAQIGTFGKLGRDPRGRTISVVFGAVCAEAMLPEPGDDAARAEWFAADRLPQLAFDHDEIMAAARAWLDS
jgi:8-oxo-dGTP diphosphatase